jgi:signal transduction histidine kinase
VKTLVASVLIALAATLVFYAAVHQIAGLWLDVVLRPDVRSVIEHSLLDQKRLRDLDPANAARYRQRFEDTRRLMNRIDVVAMNRERVLRRFEMVLAGLFAAILFAATLLWTARQRRNEERRRAEQLARLAAWQEASRRHAHEIKTPLTAARMEVDRLASLTPPSDDVRRAIDSVHEELGRITQFTKEFSSFAMIGQPVLRAEELDKVMTEFRDMFAGAWPNLTLQFDAPPAPVAVSADRDLLRQVLVNLCTNSAHATEGQGTVTFSIARAADRVLLDVADTGGGVPPSIAARIFEPYVTTRKIGHGMGLGLAISRKILLDHGGDLALLSTSPAGSTFRISLRRG